jgi:hypothetical protein
MLVVFLGMLDAAIIGTSTIFGTSQKQLLHGASAIMLPLYAVLVVAWGWLIYIATIAMRERRWPIAWSRWLIVALLAVVPLLF